MAQHIKQLHHGCRSGFRESAWRRATRHIQNISASRHHCGIVLGTSHLVAVSLDGNHRIHCDRGGPIQDGRRNQCHRRTTLIGPSVPNPLLDIRDPIRCRFRHVNVQLDNVRQCRVQVARDLIQLSNKIRKTRTGFGLGGTKQHPSVSQSASMDSDRFRST